jgi:hypothetical protein
MKPDPLLGRPIETLRHRTAVGVLALNAALVLAPSLPFFGARLVGDVTRHPLDSSTVYYLVARALTRWPPSMNTTLFDHPHGWDITHNFPDIGNAILFAPVTLAFGAIYSHNLAMLAMLFLAGVAAYALGVQLLRDRLAALLGALLFADMDPLFFAVRWGEDDVASLWLLPAWLAVWLWALRRLTPGSDHRATRTALVGGATAGAALALIGWINSYYLLFCCLISPLAWLAVAWRSRPRGGPRAHALFALALTLCFALLYGPRAAIGTPPWVPRVWEQSAADSLQTLTQPERPPRLGTNLDLPALLDPTVPRQRARSTEGVLYLGLLPLALAGWGLRRTHPRSRVLLLSLAGLGLLLALGTHLRWGDASLELGGHLIPAPLSLLQILLPPLRAVKHPYRFVSLLFLAVALLAGAGALTLARACLPRAPAATAGLLVALCIAERVLLGMGGAPIGATAIPVPSALARLPEVPGQPAVLLLPVDPTPDRHDLEYFGYHRYLMMAAHHRPIHIPGDQAWLRRPLPLDQMRCVQLDLGREGVGVIVLFDALVRHAAVVQELDDPWEIEKLQELFDPATLGPARGNLQQLAAPWWKDEEIEIHLVPPRTELEAQLEGGC